MKKAIILSMIGIFFISSVFAVTNTKVKKDSPMINQGKYLAPQEQVPSMDNPNTGVKNDFSLSTRNPNAVLIDSSSNGYGMVVSSTRPIDRDGDWWTIVFRQYAGVGTTHGQLGSAATDDILAVEDWNVYTNVNANGNPEWGGGGVCEDGTCAQGRYPSAAASEEYPYAIWNEYACDLGDCGNGSTYGGRPYISYDQFGWDGDSYSYPVNIDLDWMNETKDLWVGSAQYSWDDSNDAGIMNVAYNDWTRNNVYFFHSEEIADGLVIFGSEQNPLNLPAHFGDSGYITSPLVTTNDNGDGAIAVIGIFAGNDAANGECDEENTHSCNHIPIFKLTDDHGVTFYGDANTDGYYFIPDNVFEDIWTNNILPNSDGYGNDENGWDVDYCYNYAEDGTGNDIDYDGDGSTEPASWLYFGAGASDGVTHAVSIASASFSINFLGTNYKNSMTLMCHADKGKLNFSNNPTFVTGSGTLYNAGMVGDPKVYISTVGLYNEENELVAKENAEIKYSTIQNWYPGDEDGKGGVYNFVTKRGKCQGRKSKISWTQLETGSALTWKYPSCVLMGDYSVGEFYSVAVSTGKQQADTGTKMIHLGKHTKSTVISKGISAKQGKQTYRGLVSMGGNAKKSQNYTQCDSLLLGDKCSALTIPYIKSKTKSSKCEHEASTSKVSDEQLFYLRQRGLKEEDAVNLIVNGFVKEVTKQLPMEFAVEANKLLSVTLEGSVG